MAIYEPEHSGQNRMEHHSNFSGTLADPVLGQALNKMKKIALPVSNM